MICPLCRRSDKVITGWIKHHLVYAENGVGEVVVKVCRYDHQRLHGTGRLFGDPWAKKYGRGLAPLKFSQAVVKLYKKYGVI